MEARREGLRLILYLSLSSQYVLHPYGCETSRRRRDRASEFRESPWDGESRNYVSQVWAMVAVMKVGCQTVAASW